MGLLPPAMRVTAGRIAFEGRNLLDCSPADMRALRGARIGMVFQEPMTALNPLMRVQDQVAEVLQVHGRPVGTRVLDLLEAVGLPDPPRIARAYPHALSGGQRQRVMIAAALALEPAILIADEPTTALDVTTQKQILALIRDIQKRRGMGVLFVTHDFGVVAEIADRVAVMQRGEIVEQGTTEEVLTAPEPPLHPGADRRRAAPRTRSAALDRWPSRAGAGRRGEDLPQPLVLRRPRGRGGKIGQFAHPSRRDVGTRRRKRIGQEHPGALRLPPW